jgi:pimeloyl-ACP methyl ester carboxylesterase
MPQSYSRGRRDTRLTPRGMSRADTARTAALGGLIGLPLAAAAGWLGYSAFFVPHRLRLPHALSGERRELRLAKGHLSYYTAGPEDGDPMLLVHSVNAAGSAYEMRPLYDYYSMTRRVYAIDLPGFGFSSRGDRAYTPRRMTDAVLAMVETIRTVHGRAPIDVIALSLGCEFVARAASQSPGLLNSLALISPTGFSAGTPTDAPAGSTRAMPALRDAVSAPIWSRALFDLLTSKPSLRYFLRRAWGSRAIDERLLAYDYLTTHQPGAQFAPYAFIAGYLFSRDILAVYRSLSLPVWVAHGVRGDFTDYARLRAFADAPNWTIQAFRTGALPHFEQLGGLTAAYDAFRNA